TAGVTAWILSRAAPQEEIDLFTEEGPWTQRTAVKIQIYSLAGVFVVLPPLLLLDVHIGIVTIMAAVLLFPLGLFAVVAGKEIDKKEREFGPFLRSLGSMSVSTGSTVAAALSRIDLSSFPALEEDLIRLRSRLLASIDPELCWKKFSLETGSKLIG